MRRAYKFRAYPTRPQEGRAARLLADHCDLYDAALEERREAWRMRTAHGPIDADVNGARNVYTRAGLGSSQAVQAAREAVGFSRQGSHGWLTPLP